MKIKNGGIELDKSGQATDNPEQGVSELLERIKEVAPKELPSPAYSRLEQLWSEHMDLLAEAGYILKFDQEGNVRQAKE